MRSELSDFIAVSSPASNQNLTLLVDTESDITIIKKSSLRQNLILNHSEIILMRGITNQRIFSWSMYAGPFVVTGINDPNISISVNNKTVEIHKNMVIKPNSLN